jgi:chorismate-pyruvate lyase
MDSKALRCAACFSLIAALMSSALAQTRTERLDRLKGDLLSQPSATQVLTQWCGALHFADPPVVRAEKAVDTGAPADVRGLLKAGAAEPVRHRHVRLTCGGHVLSEADNWYLPARLTAAMNRALEETDTPFGAVVRPLNFHRQTLAAAPAGGTALQVKALLLTPDETPISLVVENYSAELIGP